VIELDDCGLELHLADDNWYHSFDVRAVMVIKAPRGTLTIFGHVNGSPSHNKVIDLQCEGIKSFMEQHKSYPIFDYFNYIGGAQ